MSAALRVHDKETWRSGSARPVSMLTFELLAAGSVLLATRVYFLSELLVVLSALAALFLAGTAFLILVILVQESGRWGVRKFNDAKRAKALSLKTYKETLPNRNPSREALIVHALRVTGRARCWIRYNTTREPASRVIPRPPEKYVEEAKRDFPSAVEGVGFVACPSQAGTGGGPSIRRDMNYLTRLRNLGAVATSVGAGILAVSVLVLPSLRAQNPELQQKLSEVKESMAVNKMLLAQYTWMEQDIISIKGDQKKEEMYNVQLGPDGKPQKTPVDPSSVSDDQRRHWGLRARIIEKKTEEYQQYGQAIKTLVQQYVPPDKDMLQQAYQAGNVMIGPMGGAPGEYRLVISNYLKQGDNMTLVMNKAQKALVSLSISTYLSDPSDAVNVNVQFARIPGGPNHVATETINGVNKQLTITVQNSNYQHQ
jgi:hypothetical protein